MDSARRLRNSIISFAILLLIIPTAILAKDKAGLILAVKGAVTATYHGKVRTLNRRSPFYVGDTIKVGETGRAQLRFNDNTLMTLKQTSVFRIDTYYFAHNKKDVNHSRLAMGSARILTGQINKTNKEAFSIGTPISTVVLRGTEVDIDVITPTQLGLRVSEGEAVIDGISFGHDFNYTAALTTAGARPIGTTSEEVLKALALHRPISEIERPNTIANQNPQNIVSATPTADNIANQNPQNVTAVEDVAFDFIDSGEDQLVYFDTAVDLSNLETQPLLYGFIASRNLSFIPPIGIAIGTAENPMVQTFDLLGLPDKVYSRGTAQQIPLNTFAQGTLPTLPDANIQWSTWDTSTGDWEKSLPGSTPTLIGSLTTPGPSVFYLQAQSTPISDLPITGTFNYHTIAFAGTDNFSGQPLQNVALQLAINFNNATFSGIMDVIESSSSAQGTWHVPDMQGFIKAEIDPVSGAPGTRLEFTNLSATGCPGGCAQFVTGPRANQDFTPTVGMAFAGPGGNTVAGSFHFESNDNLEHAAGVFVNKKQ